MDRGCASCLMDSITDNKPADIPNILILCIKAATWLKLSRLDSQEQGNLSRYSLQVLLQMSAVVYRFSDVSHWTIPKGGLDLFQNSSSGGTEKQQEVLKSAAWSV